MNTLTYLGAYQKQCITRTITELKIRIVACFTDFVNATIQDLGQSAGNFKNNLKQQERFKLFIEGSSETTREISNYNTFNTYVISSINSQFIPWFIGFFEGDGCLYTSPKNYFEFKITQSSWDLEVLYMIKQNLGFGSVDIQDKNNSTYHFRVRDQKGILTLITRINRYGNLFTEKKYERFKKWVDSYNLVYKAKVPMLVRNDKDVTFQDGWLAGFTILKVALQ